MLEQIILGIIQGVFEWLPISSEGMIVLMVENFFNQEQSIEIIIRYALFLHLGTFLAALIYFRKDVFRLIRALFNYRSASLQVQKTLKFLIISSLISGILGFILISFLAGLLEDRLRISTKGVILIIGLALFITGILQIRARKTGYKGVKELKTRDSLLLGLVQGLAVLPGLSRSGLTVSVLLLRKFDDAVSLRLSFLMSLPIVLIGNIILNFRDVVFLEKAVWGLLFSFIFGIITIDLLLRISKKVNFGYFVLFFAILVTISAFI